MPNQLLVLFHAMERGVILTKGSVIDDISLPSVHPNNTHTNFRDAQSKTIRENERDLIIDVFKNAIYL